MKHIKISPCIALKNATIEQISQESKRWIRTDGVFRDFEWSINVFVTFSWQIQSIRLTVTTQSLFEMHHHWPSEWPFCGFAFTTGCPRINNARNFLGCEADRDWTIGNVASDIIINLKIMQKMLQRKICSLCSFGVFSHLNWAVRLNSHPVAHCVTWDCLCHTVCD